MFYGRIERRNKALAYFSVNALTMIRAGAAFASALAASQGNYLESALILLPAWAVTELDGKLARRTGTESFKGSARDWIADACATDAFFLLLATWGRSLAPQQPPIPSEIALGTMLFLSALFLLNTQKALQLSKKPR